MKRFSKLHNSPQFQATVRSVRRMHQCRVDRCRKLDLRDGEEHGHHAAHHHASTDTLEVPHSHAQVRRNGRMGVWAIERRLVVGWHSSRILYLFKLHFLLPSYSTLKLHCIEIAIFDLWHIKSSASHWTSGRMSKVKNLIRCCILFQFNLLRQLWENLIYEQRKMSKANFWV